MTQRLLFCSLLQREEMCGGDLESRPLVCKPEDEKLLMNFIYKQPFYLFQESILFSDTMT